jgi:hypothetical protein
MKITPVDHVPDLFTVEDVLPESLLLSIGQQDLWQYPWEQQRMQLDWKRRKLIVNDGDLLQQVDQHYNHAIDQIAAAAHVVFEHQQCWSSFWLDYEGFDCSIHEDGAEREYNPLMAMQVYLTQAAADLGTVFNHDAQGQQVRYAFPYKINTGYLMLNHAGQYHGMLNKIPANHLRLSSYTYFGKFNHK